MIFVCILSTAPRVGLPPHVMLMAEMRETRAHVGALVNTICSDISSLPDQVELKLRRLIEDGSIETGQLTPQYLMRTVSDCLTASGLPELVEGMKNGTLVQAAVGMAAATSAPPAPQRRYSAHLTTVSIDSQCHIGIVHGNAPLVPTCTCCCWSRRWTSDDESSL